MRRTLIVLITALAMLPAFLHTFAAPQPAAGEKYQVDPVHSAALFRAQHLNLGHVWGRFNEMSGDFTWNPDNPAASRFEMQIVPASVDTGNEQRDAHLRNPDFFDAGKHPLIHFITTNVEQIEPDLYRLTGDLTLHGVTKQTQLELRHLGAGEDPWGNSRRGFEADFTVNRSDFGMDKMLDMVGDEVRLIIAFEGVRQPQD